MICCFTLFVTGLKCWLLFVLVFGLCFALVLYGAFSALLMLLDCYVNCFLVVFDKCIDILLLIGCCLVLSVTCCLLCFLVFG